MQFPIWDFARQTANLVFVVRSCGCLSLTSDRISSDQLRFCASAYSTRRIESPGDYQSWSVQWDHYPSWSTNIHYHLWTGNPTSQEGLTCSVSNQALNIESIMMVVVMPVETMLKMKWNQVWDVWEAGLFLWLVRLSRHILECKLIYSWFLEYIHQRLHTVESWLWWIFLVHLP